MAAAKPFLNISRPAADAYSYEYYLSQYECTGVNADRIRQLNVYVNGTGARGFQRVQLVSLPLCDISHGEYLMS